MDLIFPGPDRIVLQPQPVMGGSTSRTIICFHAITSFQRLGRWDLAGLDRPRLRGNKIASQPGRLSRAINHKSYWAAPLVELWHCVAYWDLLQSLSRFG